jgi:voltage-gated sodium channel
MSVTATPLASAVKPGGIAWLATLTESWLFRNFILLCIILNAITLGIDAHYGEANPLGPWAENLDIIFLLIFTLELALEFAAQGPKRFLANGWNLFDTAVVAVSYISVAPAVSALRTLRVLRVFRLVSSVPQLRRVVEAIIGATPGILATSMVLALVFYIGSVMSTTLFGQDFPDKFGNLPTSALTLFQLTLFDDWGATVKELDQVYPWAWAFILAFTVLSAFAVLNLFIGVIVDAIQDVREEDAKKRDEAIQRDVAEIEEGVEDISAAQGEAAKEIGAILKELRSLRAEVAAMRSQTPG